MGCCGGGVDHNHQNSNNYKGTGIKNIITWVVIIALAALIYYFTN
ncbi:hypothetical protein [Fonticella tunisiensis]|uniref:Uncharacterized protein n=1 Tax=Fonticella tunisiensis TaxID=1096341 RepID=A0A4R7KVS8_9CLOT|nr:hypothetical protein [Fonticella tunisiensis]TDT63651.1 hypothetical protein EDD71_10178 [Fonticella tunisiensis]